MRFKDFLAEVFNTKVTHIEYKEIDIDTSELRFMEEDQLFGVRITKIPVHKLSGIPISLNILKDKTILNVVFGDINDKGKMNFNADKRFKNTGSIKVISKVFNIITDVVDLMKPSIIVFSAKKGDKIYKSRVSLYNFVINSVQKYTNFSYIKFEDWKGTYFVMYDDDLNLSDLQINDLKKQMSDEPQSMLQQLLQKVKK